MPRINVLLLAPLLCLLGACYYSHPQPADGWNEPEGRVDSAAFAATHHYAANFNFRIVADSLVLSAVVPGFAPDTWVADSVVVRRNDKVVVADIVRRPDGGPDSVCVKVARDQFTQGWVGEARLLEAAIPDDPISAFIHAFSDARLQVFLPVLGLALLVMLVRRVRRRNLRVVHFNDIDSFYPTLQCLCVSGAAALYGSVQTFVPDTWVEFYYHPSLNPFVLPPILALFISSVWLMLITSLAVVDDVRRRLPPIEALAYLISLAAACVVLYLFFTLSVGCYGLGYVALAAYWAFALRRYFMRAASRYRCGRCGAEMKRLGRCPQCGAINK